MAMVRDSGMGDSGYGLEPGFPIVGLNRQFGPPNLTVPKNLRGGENLQVGFIFHP